MAPRSVADIGSGLDVPPTPEGEVCTLQVRPYGDHPNRRCLDRLRHSCLPSLPNEPDRDAKRLHRDPPGRLPVDNEHEDGFTVNAPFPCCDFKRF
jgi:hypothetical protein